MAHELHATLARRATGHGTVMTYVTGFVLSIALTVTAYTLVVHHELSRKMLIGSVAGLAIAQFLVQLVFFLHLGHETKPRWKLVVFLFMLLVVGIVLGGSLWIMYNLNYHMMSTKEINTYMSKQDGL
jgi:cytochrome o ubiquinol oxidase operon protein cyoD